jgi:protein gp37
MSAISSIEWTDATWNPVDGCDQISPGCAHCYAKAIHDRRHKSFIGGGNVLVPQYAEPFEVVRPRADRLDVPLHWRRPRRVFVNSMSDLFHDDVPDAFIDRVFAVMALCPQHTFQILTKRPERMRVYLSATGRHDAIVRSMDMPPWMPPGSRFPRVPEHWPLPNVWLGVSVENQHFADERIPLLLQTPAAVRFISAEPLLGPVDLDRVRYAPIANAFVPALSADRRLGCLVVNQADRANSPTFPRLDWVIVGVEQLAGGKVGRNADGYPEHARSVLDQCAAAGVARFHKQMPIRGRVSGNPAEWPSDLRVRQFPQCSAGQVSERTDLEQL